MILDDDYLENRKEQNEIRSAISSAIPANVQYYYLVMVLADLLKYFIYAYYKDDLHGESTDDR